MDAPLDRPLEELEFSVRLANALQDAGLVYVGELVQWTERDLFKLPHMGRKVMKELVEMLGGLGLSLGAEVPDWQRPDGAPIVRPPV